MKINTINFYSFLYIICIVVSFFPNYELTFLVWLFAILITIRKSYSITILKYISLFSAILLIASISSLFYKFQTFNIIKDFTYLLKPILGIILGYQLLDKFKNNGLKIFINAGVVLAVIHVFLIILTILQHQHIDLHSMRAFAGFFSDYEVYVFILLIFSSKFNIELNNRKRMLFILLIGFSIFMYLARTNFLQFAILILGVKGYFILNKKSIKVLSIVTISTLISYALIYNSNPKRNGSGIETLMYKIKIAPEEAFKTKINKNDWKDFNDNYRSFENILTVQQVTNEGIRAIIFGKGIGSTLNIGQKIHTTDGSIIQYISIAHNGFMTIFLKSGLIGVFFLLMFIYYIYHQKRSDVLSINNINLLLMGTGVFLVLSTWVFMGVYFKLDNKSIIIGFLIAYREYLSKKTIIEHQL